MARTRRDGPGACVAQSLTETVQLGADAGGSRPHSGYPRRLHRDVERDQAPCSGPLQTQSVAIPLGEGILVAELPRGRCSMVRKAVVVVPTTVTGAEGLGGAILGLVIVRRRFVGQGAA